MTKIELRNITTLQAKEDGLLVEGFIPIDSLSEVLTSGRKTFREKIAKGAFQKALDNKKDDIDLLIEHDKKRILSSTRNGSLELKETESGLFLSSKFTETTFGKDCFELIKADLIKNLSFGFRVIKDSWSQVGNQMIRTIHAMELLEVSVVRNPAYSNSVIAARGIELIEELNVPEIKKIMKKEDDKNMETIVKEYRATESTLTEELRELTTSATATAVIPENVAGEIIKKMGESSPIFEMCRKFATVNGSLKIPIESDTIEASFVGEGISLSESDLNFDFVELKQKRVGAVVSLSNQLVYDSSVDLDAYVSDLLARRTAQAIEKSILLGQGDLQNEFKGIFNEVGLTEVETAGIKSVTMDDLNSLYTSLNPHFIDGAAFIMSRAFFNMVSQLKDGHSNYYVQNGVVNGKVTYLLLGMPCYVSDAITSEEYPILFGNFHEAVGMLIKKHSTLTKISNDSTQALRGAVMYVFDLYADSATVNTQAVSKLKVKQV